MDNEFISFEDNERWLAWSNELLSSASHGMHSLDLFCGGGGLSAGMEASGFHVDGFDADADCVQTCTLSYPGSSATEEFISTQKDWSGYRYDAIVGGPPCQPFSGVGKQKGPDDARNGFPAFISAVRQIRPRVFVAENVRGVLYRNSEYFMTIVEQFRKLGYRTDFRILNACHYGVPQKRERVFLAGWLKGNWHWPEPLVSRPVTVAAALGKSMTQWDDNSRFLSPSMDTYIAAYEKASKCINPRDLHPDRPSRTVTCRNLASATSDMLRIRLPDGRRRMLTMQEGARLQSFPDKTKWYGNRASVAAQIGNAVPPLMAACIAGSIKRNLENQENNHAGI